MKRLLIVAVAVASLASTGCAVVPQNRRAKLADPMMRVAPDPLDAHRQQKLYSTREAAAGGDGVAAGGGCACQ
jgi:hypothetical protein